MKKVGIETVDCIFCHSNDVNIVITENAWQGKQCTFCSLIYISPRPSESEILDLYGHNSAHISAQTHIAGEYYSRLHARYTLDHIKKYKQDGELLEIGSGAGFLLDEARKKGFSPFAIELNPIQAQFIQTFLHIPCEQKILSENSFDSQLFDIIYHCDVISHFHNPINAFLTMYKKLNSGGFLIFETGNIADMDKKFYSAFPCFQYPDHLFFFGENTLATLLEKTGFQLVKIYRYNIMLHLFIQRLRNWQKNRGIQFQGAKETHTSDIGVIKKLYQHLLFMLRYKIGAYLPKKQRPLSLIIVAKKLS